MVVQIFEQDGIGFKYQLYEYVMLFNLGLRSKI
jgi:hypothetical protein